jgi:hypothetical protein
MNIKNVCRGDLILFIVQVLLIFMVTAVCLLNLTWGWGDQNMWTIVLTGSLGYIMPSPKLKISEQNDNLNKISINEENTTEIRNLSNIS